MKELRHAINEHIVSEKMRDVLTLMLRRIEEIERDVERLYRTEVAKRDIDDLKARIADLFEIPRSEL
ncbi:hypothetical protein K0U83_22645 [bacterium]|jgi:DNA mismatch repair ATPase MutS|nr:hypothetical protein [bacterium]|tara:strand:- start:377 stop:577 length:201 start_codon:yes stop_codon:yes gene_type:complete